MIIGRFYFRLTKSGNLLGEFSNNVTNQNFTEGADRIKGDLTSFLGSFVSTWHEGGDSFLVTLTIDTKINSTNLFSVTWVSKKSNFWGEAFIVDDLLIGDYRDTPKIP